MRAVLLLVAALVAGAGCLGPSASSLNSYKDRTLTAVLDSGIAPANRTAGEFYVVWIHGAENIKTIGGKGDAARRPCDPTLGVRVEQGRGVLLYDSHRYTVNANRLQVLVALEYEGDRVFDDAYGEGCATQSSLAAYEGRADFQHALRPDLALSVLVEPQNGFLTYNKGYFFPIGKKVHVNLTRVEHMADGHSYYATGDFEVVNLGLFTPDRVMPFANRS